MTLLLVSPPPTLSVVKWGPLLAFAGEALRIWAVRHIGVISRTRADRSGPLVVTGPFAIVRNPLYVGNMLIWSGMACWAGALWAVPLSWLMFGPYYVLISRWEESLLQERAGDPYRAYQQRVKAWLPRLWLSRDVFAPATHSWRETFFSERGTLVAVAVMGLLLSLKMVWAHS
ncbi:MAG TPA: isoprenylcysteine carboxylmethyltransferase family protein [Vicinamibacterales bacterium]